MNKVREKPLQASEITNLRVSDAWKRRESIESQSTDRRVNKVMTSVVTIIELLQTVKREMQWG